MGYPRRFIVPHGEDCVVHVTSRCCRAASLDSEDEASGSRLARRVDWVRENIRILSEAYAVDVCAYCVMNDKIHLLLWCKPSVAAEWSDNEVVQRWLVLFGPHGREWTEEELAGMVANTRQLAKWRDRLGTVSWFLRCLDEAIARKANKEEGRKGKFWHGRFQSRLLADVYGPIE